MFKAFSKEQKGGRKQESKKKEMKGKGKEKNWGCQENSANSCNGTLHLLNKTVVRASVTLENINNHWDLIKNE